jgi:hypothetical protein
MDKNRARHVIDAATKLLKALEQEGIKATYKSGTVFADFCSLKFEFAEMKKDGSVSSKEAKEYELNHDLFGLPKDGLGKEFTSGRKTYVVRGLLPRSRHCILAARKPDGKLFKFSPSIAFGMNVGLKAMEASMTDRDFEEDRINRAEAEFS